MKSGNTVAILLIEDDDIEAELIERSLRKQKIRNPVIRAKDGVEGFDILLGQNGHEKIQSPYLIFLDINMPKMNGLEFLKKLRSTPSYKESIVFMLTTSNSHKDKTIAYGENIAGYILKSNVGEEFKGMTQLIDNYWELIEFPSGFLSK